MVCNFKRMVHIKTFSRREEFLKYMIKVSNHKIKYFNKVHNMISPKQLN